MVQRTRRFFSGSSPPGWETDPPFVVMDHTGCCRSADLEEHGSVLPQQLQNKREDCSLICCEVLEKTTMGCFVLRWSARIRRTSHPPRTKRSVRLVCASGTTGALKVQAAYWRNVGPRQSIASRGTCETSLQNRSDAQFAETGCRYESLRREDTRSSSRRVTGSHSQAAFNRGRSAVCDAPPDPDLCTCC